MVEISREQEEALERTFETTLQNCRNGQERRQQCPRISKAADVAESTGAPLLFLRLIAFECRLRQAERDTQSGQ